MGGRRVEVTGFRSTCHEGWPLRIPGDRFAFAGRSPAPTGNRGHFPCGARYRFSAIGGACRYPVQDAALAFPPAF
jgi:hypothetical protein